MDSDVEMVEPPSPHVSSSAPTDLHQNGALPKEDNDPDPGDPPPITTDDDGTPPPPSNDDTADPTLDDPVPPEDAPDANEHDEDDDEEDEEEEDDEEENSSDNASEDDVDKDLVPEGVDAADAEEETKPEVTDAVAETFAIRIPVLVDAAAPDPDPAPPTSPLSPPLTSAAKPPSKKPKSHHAPPPPPPPAPPPPVQTIRLEIKLGGPENYEIDVKNKAREEGFVWGEIVSKKYADESSSEGESEGEDKNKDADGDVEMDADGKPKPKKTKLKKSTKKAKAPGEYYDITDPFIDDSELAIDERTYFAQTKQKGFYVSSGEVALVRDKSPKKPKSKKKTAPALSLSLPTASTSALKPASTTSKKAKSTTGTSSRSAPPSKAKGKALGTKDSPIPLEDDDEDSKTDVFGGAARKGKEKAEEGAEEDATVEDASWMKGSKGKERASVNGVNGDHKQEDTEGTPGGDENGVDHEVGKKRKRSVNGAGGGAGDGAKKKPKIVDITSFHPELQASIEKLKQAIAAESWETKSKFPPNLKPPLAALALQAIKLDEYDENFFNLMPNIFPYNKFTMTKLIKRTIFNDHTTLLNQRQDELLETLRLLATEGFPKAQEEWERSLSNYEEKRKEKAASNGDGDPSAEGSAGPTRPGTEDPEAPIGSAGAEDKDKTANGKDEKDGPGKGGAHHGPPLKKYRMTDAMKSTVWELVQLSNEICRLENEKNSLEGSVLQVSEQGLRKSLYQRIVAAFPEGWMSSGQISRDVSAMKKKHEKEVQDD